MWHRKAYYVTIQLALLRHLAYCLSQAYVRVYTNSLHLPYLRFVYFITLHLLYNILTSLFLQLLCVFDQKVMSARKYWIGQIISFQCREGRDLLEEPYMY
jgi:hypothetical protein